MNLFWRIVTLIVPLLGALPCHAAEVKTALAPGYERLQRAGGDTLAEQGEVLLSELSCLACHSGEKEKAPLAWKPGPDLRNAGHRLRPAFVRAFIAAPGGGTTMPNLLGDEVDPQRGEMAEDLTHYIMQLRDGAGAGAPAAGSAEDGQRLFESVGCIACHSEKPLERLGEKYAPGELARFLEKPLAVRPAARMPDLHLTGEEAAHVAAYLVQGAPPAEPPFAVEPARAKRGGELFQSLGCAGCHVGMEGKTRPGQKLASKLDLQRGCLSEKPKTGVPRYALSGEQRAALAAAITNRSRVGELKEEEPQAAIRRLMLQRNCFACHVRGGLGGPAPEVAVHFTSTKDDLGDLGRLPPPLDGVGRKLQPWALEHILRGRDRVREYMHVRMPDFGEELAPRLAEIFARADADADEKPTIAKANPNQVGRNESGRELVGTGGYACIACHALHSHPSLGIGAYDLAEMPKRLRPEWMRDFLLNPAAFPTGQRMPAFWPKGKPLNPKIGGSNAEKQIDHIRVYLTEVDQSLPPEGIMDHAAFELKPAERPIIFRTFMAGVSTHAIAVGFPGGVNVAFDALGSRWALAWRGRFLDADGTWNQRVAKMEKPLGESVVALEAVGALSIEGATPKYSGYRVGKDGVPTFLYELGALAIEDRVEPAAKGLRRTLHVRGQTNETVQFAAKPQKDLTVRGAGGAPLPAQLAFREGQVELVEEISW